MPTLASTNAQLAGNKVGILEVAQTWTTAQTFAAGLSVAAAQKLFLDGGSDTYIWENASNVIEFFRSGQLAMKVGADVEVSSGSLVLVNGDVTIPVARQLSLGGGVIVREQSANVLRCVAGGSGGVDLTSGATAWVAVSDERLKKISEPIMNAVDSVDQLRAVIGRYNEDPEDRRRVFLIAQDVQKVLPEAVVTDPDGYLGLKYVKLVPLLVAAIKELSARTNQLEAA